MSAFKVGQRVRILRGSIGAPKEVPAGVEGTVIALCERPGPLALYPNELHHRVEVDGYSGPKGRGWLISESALAPLTDPKADAFIASVKSWGPLKEKPTYADLVDSVLAYIRGGSQ